MFIWREDYTVHPFHLSAGWKRLGAWHGSLGFENYLSSVSVHICYLGRLGNADFLACLQQGTNNLGGSWEVLMTTFSYKRWRSQWQRMWCSTSYQQQIFEMLWWPGEVPKSWKKANATQSKGNKEDPRIYRPVNLTSICGQASQSLLRLGLYWLGLFQCESWDAWMIRATAKAITLNLSEGWFCSVSGQFLLEIPILACLLGRTSRTTQGEDIPEVMWEKTQFSNNSVVELCHISMQNCYLPAEDLEEVGRCSEVCRKRSSMVLACKQFPLIIMVRC